MSEKGLLGNSSTIALLTLPWLEASKKRLQEDPVKLKSLIDRGIYRDTIKSLNIGLEPNGNLYMPLYNSKLEVGGIFYFTADFETGSYEFTEWTPNYVAGNPGGEDVLVCSSILEIIFAFQMGFDYPIMVVNKDHFPHSLFTHFKKINLLHSDDKLTDMIGREWICNYNLDHELAPEDTMEQLVMNKRWGRYGTASFLHTHNPFIFVDKLWWHVRSPVTQKRYLINNDWDTFSLTYKWEKKNPTYQTTTEFWEIWIRSDVLFTSLGDQSQSIPTTEEVFDKLFETMLGIFPYMKWDYMEVLIWWIMYTYIFPFYPGAPNNLMVQYEDQNQKQSFEWIMNNYFLPWNRSIWLSWTMASTVLLKVDRTSLPMEWSTAPKLMIASIRDWWFDYHPMMFFCEATGQIKDLRETKFVDYRWVKNLLFRWSLGYKSIPNFTIPQGRSRLAFLYLVCKNEKIIDKLVENVFEETDQFLMSVKKNFAIIPKVIYKDHIKFKPTMLWKRPMKRISKKESLNSSEVNDSSVSE